jgi:hypothetical protein
MQVRNERGEGRLSTFIWLVVIAASLYAAWNVFPIYVANYTLKDKMSEIARTPRGQVSDEKVVDLLMKEVKELDLYNYIGKSNFRVTTLETSRKISCDYEREGQVLPGWKHTFRFSNYVDQPQLY